MPVRDQPDRDFRASLLEDASTRRFLKWLLGFTLAAGLLYTLALLIARESLFRGFVAVAVLFFSAGALWQYRRQRYDAAAQIMVWGLWLSLTIQVTLTNGLQSRSLMALPLIIILAGWLLPARGTWALCLASLVTGSVLALGEAAGHLPLFRSPSPVAFAWLAYVIYIALAGLAAWHIFLGFRMRFLAQKRMSEDIASQAAQSAESETELRLIMESVPVMLFRADRAKRCLYANRHYVDFYGSGRSDLRGLTVREIVGAEVYEAFEIDAKLDRALAGEAVSYRAERPNGTGGARLLDVNLIPEPDGTGGTRGFIALFRDVTEEVLAAEALRRSEERIASVFRVSPLAISFARLEDGCYLDVNEAFERLTGWRRDEVIGRTSVALGHWVEPQDREIWAEQIRCQGRVHNYDTKLRTRSGEIRRVLTSAERIDLGSESSVLVMIADMTERFLAEERAREAYARFEAIFEHTPSVAIQGFTPEGVILHWNQASADLYGVPAAQALGRRLPDLLLADADAEAFYATVRGIAKTRQATPPGEWPVQLRDGRSLWVYSALFPVLEDGEVAEIFCMDVDITARKEAEEALRASSERFVKVFQASPVAISISRLADGFYLDVNDAFVEQFGWSRAEMLGRTSVEIGIWPNAEERARWIEAIRRTKRLRNYEAQLNTKSGAKHTVLISVEEITLGAEACIVGLVYDITQRLAAEQEIRRLNSDLERRVQERTAELTAANRELESFAYSISHDLRAPLRSIDGFSHLLAEEYAAKLEDTGRSYLDRVRRAAQRMGRLIDDILELSRVTRQSMHRSQVDLSRMAREVMDELAHAAPERTVVLDLAENLTAQGDPQLLRVVMQNLLENAWKYSSRASMAQIRIGKESNGSEEVYFVADNGVGFDMVYADRLFVPFQRLHKPEDFEGTGIGLATVARIVHRHGGKVWAESAPGQGTTLRFTLPKGAHDARLSGNRSA